jgi:hypothetical protein
MVHCGREAVHDADTGAKVSCSVRRVREGWCRADVPLRSHRVVLLKFSVLFAVSPPLINQCQVGILCAVI